MRLHTPPGLVAAALALWGWRSGHWVSALALAVLLEGHRLVQWRWELEDRDFNRLADFSTVAFALLAVYQFTSATVLGIYGILGWMPVVLAPLLAAERYSSAGSINRGALFPSLRRVPPEAGEARIRLGYAYVLVCLLSATPGTGDRGAFLLAAAVVLGWALAPLRPRRGRNGVWAVAVLLVSLAALGAGRGMLEVREVLQKQVSTWVAGRWWPTQSPDSVRTAIGSLGRLKLSERIEVRVEFEQPPEAPVLLREATYAVYHFGAWHAGGQDFELLDRAPDQPLWALEADGTATRGMRITTRLDSVTALAPLPAGARGLASDDITAVQRNTLDTVQVDSRPGFMSFEVDYSGVAPARPAPGPLLRAVPDAYRPATEALAAEILQSLDDDGGGGGGGVTPLPAARVAALRDWFTRGFRYSLYSPTRTLRLPLIDFMTRARAGHCEYFASATVLLLRALGIPARYAVGYVIEEYSPLEQRHVGRARHRHAWAEAWLDGRWQVVDTTPAVWAGREAEAAGGLLRGLGDLHAWLRYRMSGLAAGEVLRPVLPWLLLPLMLLLFWRLRHRRRGTAPLPADPLPPARGDSELAVLTEALAGAGCTARPGETLRHWLRRAVASRPGLGKQSGEVEELLRLRYRQRFHSAGIAPEARGRLRELAGRLAAALGPGRRPRRPGPGRRR